MSQDPWERREREREKLRSYQRERGKGSEGDPLEWLGSNGRPLGLLVGVALLLLAEIPAIGGFLRSALAIGGTTVLLLLLALGRTWSRPLKEILLRPPGLGLLALVLWTGFAFFLSPYRGMAGAELLRVVAGAAAFFIGAYSLDARERQVVLGGLLTLGCLVALGDLSRLGRTDAAGEAARWGDHSASPFGTHEIVGSQLALLLPVALALALLGELKEKLRWTAYAAVLILGIAWVVARCRSAWLGGGVALLALLVLGALAAARDGKNRRPRTLRDRIRDAIGSPLPILVGALLVMGIGGGLAGMLSDRAASLLTLGKDSSFQTRRTMWEGGARMAAQKPLLGWGLGSYPVLQGYWTHLGDEDWKVLQEGADHSSIAHNFYVQWGAEAGAIGLFLHVVATGSWLLAALRGAGGARAPAERAVLLGASAAVFGSCLDAVGSPAYQFHGVYTLLWTVMGLGAGALGEREPSSMRPGPLPYILAMVFGAALAAALPLWGRSLGQRPLAERGEFVVVSDPPGPNLPPGTTVTLRAEFTDASGKKVSTSPGTTWEVPSERESGTLRGGFGRLRPDVQSTLTLAAARLTLPSKPGAIVQVMARYNDREGRPYSADAVFRIQSGAGTNSRGNP